MEKERERGEERERERELYRLLQREKGRRERERDQDFCACLTCKHHLQMTGGWPESCEKYCGATEEGGLLSTVDT